VFASPFECERIKICSSDQTAAGETPMLSSTMVRAPVRLMAVILLAQMSLASRADGQANQIHAEPTRTAKERLSGKASDEQRVDNCKVPPALRGPKPRPDECPDGASTRSRK
jgi:hypothetical protein